MKKQSWRRVLSVMLCSAIVTTMAWPLSNIESKAGTTENDSYEYSEVSADAGHTVVAENTLISEDFSDIEVGAVPKGWVNYEGKWVWNGSTSPADIFEVVEVAGEKRLKMSDTDGTVAAVLPSLGTSNYVIDAEIYIENTSGALGLLTNIVDPVTSSDDFYVTHNVLKIGADWVSSYNRWQTGTDSNINSNVVSPSEKLDSMPVAGDKVKLTACNYNGYTYFYINDVFMTKVAYAGTFAATSLCGIYLSGNTFYVDNVLVRTLGNKDLSVSEGNDYSEVSADAEHTVVVGDTIITEDFSNIEVGTVPQGWVNYEGKWVWNGSTSPADIYEVVEVAGEKRLKMSDADGTVAAVLPSLGTSNYVMDVDIYIENTASAIGLLTNIVDPVTSSDDFYVTHNVLKIGADWVSSYNRWQTGTDSNINSNVVSPSEKLDSMPVAGGKVKLTACNYDGYTYFYINDIFMTKVAYAGTFAATSLCGIYLCGGGAIYVDSVLVRKLVDEEFLNREENDISKQVFVLERLLEEDFSGLTGTELPEGWTLFNGTSSQNWGWDFHNGKTSIVDGGLKFSSSTDGALILPSVGTSNYLMTATIQCATDNNYMGLLSNIIDPVKNSTGATQSYIQMKNKGAEIIQLNRAGDAKKDAVSVATTDILNALPGNGTELKLSIYSYEGSTYFYVNDIFVSKIEQSEAQMTRSLCGFYVCAATMIVKNVTVDAVGDEADLTKNDISNKVTVLKRLVDEDFSGLTGTELPEGWTLFNGACAQNWGWDFQNGRTSIVNGGLQFSSSTDGALILPSLGTSDYLMTATIQCTSDNNYMGLLSNIIDPLTNSTGATTSFIQMKNKGGEIIQYNRVGDAKKDTVNVATTDILDALPGNGTELKLSVYSFAGETHFYINDVFVSKITQPTPQLKKSLCGFYLCASSMIIKNVTVDAIGLKNDISRVMYGAQTLVEEDFSGLSERELPEGWMLYHSSASIPVSNNWAWNPDAGRTEIVENGIKVSASDGTAALLAPSLGTADYVMTAKLILSGQNHAGLLTNIADPVKNSDVATYSYIDHRDNTVHLYNRYTTYQFEHQVSDMEKVMENGTEVTLTAYSYDGYTYFYINNEYVDCISHYSPREGSNLCGIYVMAASVIVKSVTVKTLEVRGNTNSLQMVGTALRYAEPNGVVYNEESGGLRFAASFDKANEIYASYWKDSYKYRKDADVQLGMLIAPETALGDSAELTVDTPGVWNVQNVDIDEQDDENLSYSVTLLRIPHDETDNGLDRYYAARAYMRVKVDGEYEYYYSSEHIERNQARLATRLYTDENMITDDIKAILDSMYQGKCNTYLGANAKTLSFTVFSDFHYKKGMYAQSIENLETIFDRANANNSDLVISLGDFCNDFIGSPELTDAFLYNQYDLKAYNIYGNHELESPGNTMEVVTPTLTNDTNVIWGTEDGQMDPSIGYYYVDHESGFRLVFTDNNYSWDATNQIWEHNEENSWTGPSGNQYTHSFGPQQLEWLEEVLTDAARKGIPCIVAMHASASGSWGESPDSDKIREIYKKVNDIQRGTVLMSINGHTHQDHSTVVDGVLYWNCTAANNSYNDMNQTVTHYSDEHTFTYVPYINGLRQQAIEKPINELSTWHMTWYSQEVLSANIRISTAGYIEIEGMTTGWLYDVVPDYPGENIYTTISNLKYNFSF